MAKRDMMITELEAYLQGLVAGDAKPSAALMESYITTLRYADSGEKSWRYSYYWGRGFVIVGSATITAITGFNLHGGAAVDIRWLILVLSALVTIITGMLELLQAGNRWRLYRQLRSKLQTLGWQARQRDKNINRTLASLGSGLISAVDDFEIHYASQVEGATGKEGEEQDKGNGEDNNDKGT